MSNGGRFIHAAREICEQIGLANPTFIGSGAFKEAYLVADPDERAVTLKIFDPAKCDLCRADREIHATQQCESPLIGKIYHCGSCSLADESFLYVVEEYLSGGTLTDKLESGELDVNTIYDYGISLMRAVIHLRDRNLVHRDIKPDNIMFREGDEDPVIVDFGLVRDLSSSSLTRTFLQQGPGTPFFASPEQLNNDKYLIDWRSDQFSIGVILSLCLNGIHPYQELGDNEYTTVLKVQNHAGVSSLFQTRAEEGGYLFLSKMVAAWPVDRFTHPSEIINQLEALRGGTR